MELRVWEVRESECRPAIGRIGIEASNIIPPEREQTSEWSLWTRLLGEPLERRKANERRPQDGVCTLPRSDPLVHARKTCAGNHLSKEAYVASREIVNAACAGL